MRKRADGDGSQPVAGVKQISSLSGGQDWPDGCPLGLCTIDRPRPAARESVGDAGGTARP